MKNFFNKYFKIKEGWHIEMVVFIPFGLIALALLFLIYLKL